jgi:uncharacterized protein
MNGLRLVGKSFWSGLLWLLGSTLAFGLTPIPQLKAPVTDLAQVLDPRTEDLLNSELRKLWESKGSQLAVLTVSQLEGETIEQYSIRVTDQWQLGTKDGDNGVLLVMAVQDRRLRIEVGQGLEGVLTDAYANRIIQNAIVPLLREGSFDSALVSGVHAILRYTDPGFHLGGEPNQAPKRKVQKTSRAELVILILFLIFAVLSPGRVRFGSRRRGGWYGGPSGGGGGFGGGFGGGGGGFSGGGSSGQW